MEFRILGPLEVCEGKGAVSLGGPKQRALLAILLGFYLIPGIVGGVVLALVAYFGTRNVTPLTKTARAKRSEA